MHWTLRYLISTVGVMVAVCAIFVLLHLFGSFLAWEWIEIKSSWKDFRELLVISMIGGVLFTIATIDY